MTDFINKGALKRLLAILYLATYSFLLSGQVQRYPFHHLSPEEGLSQAYNDFVYHDSRGFIWLSSLDGLNRFDGQEVKVYKSVLDDSTSLLGNIITSNFFEDENANLWFTTYEGIHCYLRAKDHFVHFQLKNEDQQLQKQDYYAFHLDPRGKLWVRVGIDQVGRLHLFDIHSREDTIVCPLDGQRNYPVLNEKEEVKQVVSAIFSTSMGLKIREIQAPYHQQTALEENFIHHINIGEGDHWLLSTGDGFFIFHPKTRTTERFTTYQGLPIGNVFSSLNINDSISWVATERASILLFNRIQNRFTGQIPVEEEKKYGLNLIRVNNLHLDNQDNIWLTSTSEGVNFTNLHKQKFNLPAEFVDENIQAIYESSRGAVFCSSRNKIAWYATSNDAPVFVEARAPAGIRQQSIKYFFENKDSLLFAVTTNHLFRWDQGQQQFEYEQDLPASILFIYKKGNGSILFTTYGGIYEWTDRAFTPFQQIENYQKSQATAIYIDQKDQLLLALDASRIVVLKNTDTRLEEVQKIEGIGYAKAFHEEDSLLWVATSTGLLKIAKADYSYRLLNEEEDGVPKENYYCILVDKEGDFWMSCNKGIVRYDPEKKRHQRYNLADGLQGNEFNTNAFLKSSNGEFWMGGTKGLNRFFPANIKPLPFVPKVQFVQLWVNDEPYPTEPQIEELETQRLPYEDNTFSLSFVALEYSDPENNKLQYQLENHENDWVDAGKDGFARYSNLPPGRYVFKVRAANPDGIWGLNSRDLKIHIKTPWWMSWWFYVLCFLLIGSIIYGIFLYRLRQALKIERMRVKISSDLHDDVGTLLSGLAMQSELLEMTASKERKPKLQRIGEMSRSAMSRMRDTVWAIDARKDKLEDLIDRIRDHAMETLEPKNISFQLEVENLTLNKNIPSRIRQNLYLICKEAITNTAKYSSGDSMNISFKKTGRKEILLHIEDNGTVDSDKIKTSGLGLSNMRMRAEQIGGQLEINTEKFFQIRLYFSSSF